MSAQSATSTGKGVEVTPNYFTLDPESELYKELSSQPLWYIAPRITRSTPRFYDISAITENPARMRRTINAFVERYRALPVGQGPTHILGFDARGFIIGAPVALELGLPFVLVRKIIKMPGSLIHESYNGEHVKLPDTITVRHGSVPRGGRVVLIDDFIASGETIVSGIQLMEAIAATVVEVAAVTTMPHLHGVSRIHNAEGGAYAKTPIFTLFHDCTEGMFSKRLAPAATANRARPGSKL